MPQMPAGLPPNIQNMMSGMNPAMMNQLMQRFGGMGGLGGQQQQAPAQTEPKVGQVFHAGNNAQLQKIIKETPGVIIDFWSPTCPPCMRIKPTFEAAAKANDNPNLVFVAVNTSEARDCAMAFQVNAIPNFIAFNNGQQVKNFKGANEQQLFATIAELSEKVPKGKVKGAGGHDQMVFKQFKPTHLAPQAFTTLG